MEYHLLQLVPTKDKERQKMISPNPSATDIIVPDETKEEIIKSTPSVTIYLEPVKQIEEPKKTQKINPEWTGKNLKRKR